MVDSAAQLWHRRSQLGDRPPGRCTGARDSMDGCHVPAGCSSRACFPLPRDRWEAVRPALVGPDSMADPTSFLGARFRRRTGVLGIATVPKSACSLTRRTFRHTDFTRARYCLSMHVCLFLEKCAAGKCAEYSKGAAGPYVRAGHSTPWPGSSRSRAGYVPAMRRWDGDGWLDFLPHSSNYTDNECMSTQTFTDVF